MKQILIGTTNPSKFANMVKYLEDLAVAPISPKALGIRVDAPETARTAEGNALEKALAWHQATGLPVLTEDSGLVLLDLPLDHPDQPGVHVRRAAGYEMSDDEMFAWFTALAHRHGGKLRAAWQDAWCVLADEHRYATCADSTEDLEQWAFWMIDKPVHDVIQPGWPLERIIIRPQSMEPTRKWRREALAGWLKEHLSKML